MNGRGSNQSDQNPYSQNHVLNLHQHFITLIYNSKLLTCKPVGKFQRYQHNLEDVESGHVSGQFKTS